MVRISVVCPTFNSSKFIEETLDRVLNQTKLPDEIVISDDGSSDDTLTRVECFFAKYGDNFSWRILRNEHRGPGAARNSGIKHARYEWVAFLDSDDLWEKNKIKEMAEAILHSPDANFFCHDEFIIGKNGKTRKLVYGLRYRVKSPLPPQVYYSNMFSTSAVVCRRDLFLRHGFFDEKLMSAQDYELWLRLSPFIDPVFVHRILGQYVLRDGNITSTSLSRRLRNELKIAIMHRNMVSWPWFVVRILRVLLSYVRQFVRIFKSRISK